MLDRTEQRIVGVLIEKELTVPDTYPLSENALVDGCNQKNNRDPVMELLSFQVAGALMALQEKGWVARVEGGGRVAKYRHRVQEQLHVDGREIPVLAELLLRGPQAPGALKPRVARMGLHAEPAAIEAILAGLARRPRPLGEQLPLGPRERDRRWRHLVGDGTEQHESERGAAVPAPAAVEALPDRASVACSVPVPGRDALAERVGRLELEVAELRAAVESLRRGPSRQGDAGA